MKKQFTLNAYGLYSPLDVLGALAMGAKKNKVPLVDWAHGSSSAASNAFPTAGEIRFDEKRDVDDVVVGILNRGLVEDRDGLRIMIKGGRPLNSRVDGLRSSKKPDLSIFVPCNMERFKAGLPQDNSCMSMKVSGDMLMRLQDYIGNEWTEDGVHKRMISSGHAGHEYVYSSERLQFLERAASLAPASDAKAIKSSLDFINRFEVDYHIGTVFAATALRSKVASDSMGKSFVIGSDITVEEIEARLEELGCSCKVAAWRDGDGLSNHSAMIEIERNGEQSYLGLNSAIFMAQERTYAENHPNLFSGLSVISVPSINDEVAGLTKEIVQHIAALPSAKYTFSGLPLNTELPVSVKDIADPVARHLATVRGFDVEGTIAPDTMKPQEASQPSLWVKPPVSLVAPTSALSDIASAAKQDDTPASFATQSEVVAYALKKAMPEAHISMARDPVGNANDDTIVALSDGRIKLVTTFSLENDADYAVCQKGMVPMTVSIRDNRDDIKQSVALMNELFGAEPVSGLMQARKVKAEREAKGQSAAGRNMTP